MNLSIQTAWISGVLPVKGLSDADLTAWARISLEMKLGRNRKAMMR
jgi:hypothetical protein